MQIDVNMQLSHMLANDIARSGEESAILDTVHALQRPVTRDSLSSDIQEVFHITIADSKLAAHVKNMLLDGRLIERDSTLILSPSSLETITQQIISNEAIEQKALSSWIHQLETTLNRCLDDVEAISVRGAIIKFVARFFITHGAGCFDFINGIKAQKTEKLDDVANLIVESQEDCIVAGLSKQVFSHFLVSIFSKDKTVEQEAYLLIQLRKAIQYISIAHDAQQSQVEIGALKDELTRSQTEKENQREANSQLVAELKKEFERQHAEKHIIAQGAQTQAETKQRLSEYEQRVDTLQQFYDEAQRKKKRNRLILWGLVLTLAIWGIFAAGAIVILSVLVLIPYSAHFAMNALSWLAKLCGMQNESVISFAGYASGVVSAVPLAVLSWIAKTAWKKIRGNIGGFLTVSSN